MVINVKNLTVCFSGHRPEKLPIENSASKESRLLKNVINKEIEKSISAGYTNFITGMSRGVDLWAGKQIATLKKTNPNLKLICAIPYKTFGDNFKGIYKWDFNIILENADEVIYLCEFYEKYCMKKRNEYMVQNSDKLIAVVNNYRSGTGQTIRLAEKNKLDIVIIDPLKAIEQ